MEDKKIKDAEVVNDTKTPDKTETTTPTLSKEEVEKTPTDSVGRMPILAFIAGVATALIAWQLYSAVTIDKPRAQGDYPNPVATVDGEAVDQELFEDNINNLLAGLAAQGVDTSDESIRAQYEADALEVIVNTRLLVNAAEAAGYAPTDEEIDERITMLEAQFGSAEALDAELTTLGLTRDDLRVDVIEQLSVDALLTTEVIPEEIEVTDAEVQELYDGIPDNGQGVPELETIREAIVAQIQQQKQQAYIEEYLEELRAEADIEINL